MAKIDKETNPSWDNSIGARTYAWAGSTFIGSGPGEAGATPREAAKMRGIVYEEHHYNGNSG
ncbi:MAG TPA: hypothetical protein VJH90_03890 [archaeon]|nr:hypothetical protein [archaeon]